MNNLVLNNIFEYKEKELKELNEINNELNKIANSINEKNSNIIDTTNKSTIIENYIATVLINNSAIIPGGLEELSIKTLLKNEETQLKNIENIKKYIILLRKSIIKNNNILLGESIVKKNYEIYSNYPFYYTIPIKINRNNIYNNDSLHPLFNTANINLSDDEINKLFDFKSLTNIILSNKFTPYLSTQGKVFTNVDDVKSDPNIAIREFLDQSTSFINEDFFRSEETNYNFLSTICNTIDEALTEYKIKKGLDNNDIYFIYKGGNALRSIFNKYEKLLPYQISKMVKDNFSSYFKKSDSDFTIIINPTFEETKWNNISEDIQKLMYLCLNRLRNIFLARLELYFDFYRLNRKIKKEKLENQLNEINKKDNSLGKYDNPDKFISLIYNNLMIGEKFNPKNIGLDDVINDEKIKYDWNKYLDGPYRSDIFIDQIANGIDIYGIQKIHNDENLQNIDELAIDMKLQNIYYNKNSNVEFYISWNKEISYSKYNDNTKETELVSFTLIRMKINFINYYIKNGKYGIMSIPGELIDISIPKPNSYELKKLNLKNNGRDIMKYTLKSTDNISFDFFGFTYSYYHHDLNKMLLHETDLIWQLPKYQKRLNRLFFIITIIFIKEVIRNKNNVFNLFTNINVEINKINEIIPNNFDDFITILETLKNIIEQYNISNYNDIIDNNDLIAKYNFENIVDFFLETSSQFKRQKTLAFNNNQENYKKINEFATIVVKNMLMTLEIARKFNNYLDNPNKFFINDSRNTIFDTDTIVSFGGGKLEKYKIKTGYLSY
jgi:hypothetical protein